MNLPSTLVVAGALGLCGCTVQSAGPAHNDFRVIERDDSETVLVKLQMGAGDLRVGSGTEKLARADFVYNVESLKPEVRYTSAARRGNLTIEQPSTSGKRWGNMKYEWDVRLNRDVAVDLETQLGAGQGMLDLGGLNMHSVDVNMGVGELKLDLRGQPRQDYTVHIRGGVGEATVRLPSDVGVYVEATGGIGDISAKGMHSENGSFYNDAYKHAKNTIRMNIQGGIGSIRLIAD